MDLHLGLVIKPAAKEHASKFNPQEDELPSEKDFMSLIAVQAIKK